MTLNKGQRLGPYEIEAPIGKGGMGEVYRARDTRLDRAVAIKVLPSHSAMDDDMRARFDREAKTISSLNHPNVCTLYDVGHEDCVDFLVMEFLEGEPINERLKRGPFDTADVLAIGVQIAGALDEAHRKGLVHRDLKPSNIFLTKDGARLLDFGLAKFQANAVAGMGDETMSTPVTGAGAIVGTLQYMSPEQLEGEDADVRSDIFAFGATLYEMVTGQRAFTGESKASLIGSIMKEDPRAVSELKPTSAPALDRLIRKCLQKDPDKRWQSASDLRDELEWIASAGSQAGIAKPVSTRRQFRMRLSWTVAAACAAVALVLAISLTVRSRFDSPKTSMHFPIEMPDEYRLNTALFNQIAASPEGDRWVTRAVDSAQKVRALLWEEGKPSPRLLAGSERFHNLLFSPDGNWLLFFDEGHIKKLHVGGGDPVEICDGKGFGAFWTPQDTIYYCRSVSSGIWKIPAAGGAPEQVTEVAENEFAHWSPEVLPGGRGLLFTIWKTSLKNISTALLDFRTGKYKTIIRSGANARWVPTGHLVFLRQGTLMAVPFDLKSMKVSGSEVPVIQDISQASDVGIGNYAFSQTGLMIYQREVQDTRRLYWVDQHGNRTSLPVPPDDYGFMRLSPNGRYLSYNKSQNGETNIWIMELETGKARQITYESENFAARWHPDGNRIAFTSYRNGPFSVYEMPVDRSQPARPLIVRDVDVSADSYTPDGLNLLATVYTGDRPGSDILVMSLADTSNSHVLIAAPREQDYAIVHPGGKWVAYQSNETGRQEVFITHLSDQRRSTQVSIDGGRYAHWSADGRTIYYWKNDKLMAASVTVVPQLRVDIPRELFEMKNVVSYDVTSDGRFIMSVAERTQEPQIVAITNWFEELKRLTDSDE